MSDRTLLSFSVGNFQRGTIDDSLAEKKVGMQEKKVGNVVMLNCALKQNYLICFDLVADFHSKDFYTPAI